MDRAPCSFLSCFVYLRLLLPEQLSYVNVLHVIEQLLQINAILYSTLPFH